MRIVVGLAKLAGYALVGYWAGRVVGGMLVVALCVKLMLWVVT